MNRAGNIKTLEMKGIPVMSNESEREITNEQWMNFAERYVLRSAGLESEVEGLKR